MHAMQIVQQTWTGADCWGGQHEPKNVAVGNISSGRNETLTTTTVAAEKEVRDQRAYCSENLHITSTNFTDPSISSISSLLGRWMAAACEGRHRLQVLWDGGGNGSGRRSPEVTIFFSMVYAQQLLVACWGGGRQQLVRDVTDCRCSGTAVATSQGGGRRKSPSFSQWFLHCSHGRRQRQVRAVISRAPWAVSISRRWPGKSPGGAPHGRRPAVRGDQQAPLLPPTTAIA